MANDPRSDTDLLLAYGRDRDEAAFTTLAARHVDMIFAVSLRRSNNRQLAEEATQNVLIALSMKARKLSANESNLTGWLHKSTRFEVAKLQRRESRIRQREQAYASETMSPSTTEDDETFRRLYPLLDQAIDHLRTDDREVIVRRHLEGQSFSHIGKALGISEDTAQKRTSRAFERLNQFFRKKAGLTVSAAALTAGLTRHSAEAAPAICLDIAGKTLSTGLTSILSTSALATMSLTKIYSLAASIIILGGTITLLTTKKLDEPPAVATAPNTPPAASPGTQGAATLPVTADNTTDTSGSYSPNEESARLEAMSPHPGQDEFARRLSVKHERLLKELTVELALSPTQAASLKAVLDARLKTFREALDSPDGEMAMITKTGGIIRGIGLREEISGIVSNEQLTAFDRYEAEAQQTQIESFAYTELSKITPVLDLSENQKDQVFALLQTSSEAKLKETADARAFMALQAGQSPAQMELTALEEVNFLHESFEGPNPVDPRSPEFREKALDVIGRQIHGEVAVLAPVLDERQEQRYREHLYQKSILPTLGIKLPVSK